MLSVKRLSYEDALILLKAAEKKARKIGVRMCIAVADESGNLIAFQKMNDSKVLSVTLAQDKAFTAAIAKRGTHEYNELCVPGSLVFGIHTSLGGRFAIVGGGLPVIVEGDVVGGIGVSGGAPEQDIECAQAGLDAFAKV